MRPYDIYEQLNKVIRSPRFLNNQLVLQSVPFYICHFDPRDAVEMETIRRNLAKKLSDDGIPVYDLNLYDLTIELLVKRGIWEQVLEMEPEMSRDEMRELLQGVLDTESHLVPALYEKVRQADFRVLFLSGIGEVFPYIRSHNILDNLQSSSLGRPMVMFFPGDYIYTPEYGSKLVLFGKLHGDKHYRAFDILQLNI